MRVCLLFFVFLLSCTTKQEKGIFTKISIENLTYDFKKIPRKEEVNTSFYFENIGDENLVILDVKTGCGCTVPNWSKEKIKPGEKGKIKVSYDANQLGHFKKTITVFYNGKDSPKELIIEGEVLYLEELNDEKD